MVEGSSGSAFQQSVAYTLSFGARKAVHDGGAIARWRHLGGGPGDGREGEGVACVIATRQPHALEPSRNLLVGCINLKGKKPAISCLRWRVEQVLG
jgi:hypothetical protein